MPTFADVSREKYLPLTTFTKDGRPKPGLSPPRCGVFRTATSC